jgi:F-type H+-transporting ATPase subunit gamma
LRPDHAGTKSERWDRPTAEHAAEIVEPLIAAYSAGELASVDLVQAQFPSPLQTPPATVRILPVEPPATAGIARDYLLAPSAEAILEQLLPLYVRNAVYRGLVETAAAEHGARRTAMKNATDNAGEILEILKRTYNRQRQAQITQEIAEIVGGAAALQG